MLAACSSENAREVTEQQPWRHQVRTQHTQQRGGGAERSACIADVRFACSQVVISSTVRAGTIAVCAKSKKRQIWVSVQRELQPCDHSRENAYVLDSSDVSPLFVADLVAPLAHVYTTNAVFPEVSKHYVTLFLKSTIAPDSGPLQTLEPEKCVGWQWMQWTELRRRHRAKEIKLFNTMIDLIEDESFVI